jgi:hypothetical protein
MSQGGVCGADRHAAAFEQADADEIADGALYGVALVDLTPQVGDG